jgi:hypothetical protein
MAIYDFMGLFPEEGRLIREAGEALKVAGKNDNWISISEKLGNCDENAIKEAILSFAKSYNKYVSGLKKRFPETTNLCWQYYRRSSKMIAAIDGRGLKAKRLKDSDLAKAYSEAAERTARNLGQKIMPLDAEPPYQLFTREPSSLKGIELYVFDLQDDKKVRKVKSVWDLTQKEIPVFKV